jgi:molybdopterin-guanine dinucleotide biosynthesis protein MobB
MDGLSAPPVPPLVVSVLGLKKSGKTTVASALIAALRARGYRVAALKKTHLHLLSLDPRGTDSFRLAEAGALFVAARSREETLTVHREPQPDDLEALLALVPPSMQIVVAEGVSGPRAHVVLCLKTAESLEETLRVRSLGAAGLLALSGVFAADPQAAASLRASPRADALPASASANAPLRQGELPPAFNVLVAEQREALCERVLAADAHLRPATEPAGPLVADPSWRPE